MSLQNKTILLIEDDIDIVLLIKKLVESQGAQIAHAQTLDQGINLLQTIAPHLVLLDLNLNQENGLLFLKKRMELDSSTKNIPVMIITSSNGPKMQKVGLALGANDFYEKPIKTITFIPRIKSLLKEFSYAPFIFKDAIPQVKITVDAELTHINEIGCMIISSSRLGNQQSIHIKSKLFTSLGMDYCKFTPINDCGRTEDGYYRSEVAFIGIQDETSKKIRALPADKA
jgi:DNA-binding response OmpR family regulator